MKLPKFSVLALAAGLFVASCGSNNSQTDRTDSVSTSTTTEMPAENTQSVSPMDTAIAPPATPVDSINK